MMPIRTPRRLFRIALNRAVLGAALVSALPATALAQEGPHTPAAGTPERAAILDALRPGVERRLRIHVTFADVRMKVANGWAFVRAIPYVRAEEHADTLDDLRGLDWQMDPFVYALLRGGTGGWTVVEQTIGAPPGSLPYVPWATRPGVPLEIFERDAEDESLELAMREFIEAMATADGNRFLALLPATGEVREVNTISADSSTETFTRAQLAADFARKGDQWAYWFGETDQNGEKVEDFYAEGFQPRTGTRRMWRRSDGYVYYGPERLRDGLYPGVSYIKWAQEDGRWVIIEIATPAS
jgi:hypothetical protein